MKKQLQGIALILFGILLCTSGYTLNDTLLADFSNFPFELLGIIIGIAGLVFVFKEVSDKKVKYAKGYKWCLKLMNIFYP